jgi:preprotein translocase subunit SecD
MRPVSRPGAVLVMLEYSRWKYVVILIVVLISALYALPNIYPQDPSVQVSATRGAKIDDALKKQVAEALAKAGLKPKEIEQQGEDLLVRTMDLDAQSKSADTLREALNDNYDVSLNLASNVPDWLTAIGARPMALGLDLQGGVHFLMEVDRKAAIDKRFDAYLEDVRVQLRDAGVGYESVERSGERGIAVTLNRAADLQKAQGLVQKSLTTSATDTGSGGFVAPNAFTTQATGNLISVQVSEEIVRGMTLNAIEQNLGTLRNRVNARACRTPATPSASSAPPPRWNTAACTRATPSKRAKPATCRPARACTKAATSAPTASPRRCC